MRYFYCVLLLACVAGCRQVRSEEKQCKNDTPPPSLSHQDDELKKIIAYQNMQIQALNQRIAALENGQKAIFDEQRRNDKQLLLRMALQKDYRHWKGTEKALRIMEECYSSYVKQNKTPTSEDLRVINKVGEDISASLMDNHKERMRDVLYIGIPLSENELEFFLQYFNAARDLHAMPLPYFNAKAMPLLYSRLTNRELQRQQYQSSISTTRP